MPFQRGSSNSRRRPWRQIARRRRAYLTARLALLWWITGLAISAGAITWGQRVPTANMESGFWACWARYDGHAYEAIAKEGYKYHPDHPSNVAFFPIYPLLARYVAAMTGLSHRSALLAISWIAQLADCVLLACLARGWDMRNNRRMPATNGGRRPRNLSFWVLGASIAWPPALFTRMAYSESLFLLTVLCFIHNLNGEARLRVGAIWSGLATAIRPVGVALLPALLLNKWRTRHTSRLTFNGLMGASLAAVSGLILFMTYLHFAFGDALAFARTQGHYRVNNVFSLREHLASLLSFEPLWSVYMPTSRCYWQNYQGGNPFWLFNLQFMNPVWWLLAVVLLVLGWRCKWVNDYEACLSFGLLAIPYLTRSVEMCMNSQARYTVVVAPIYLAMGYALSRLPRPVAAAVLVASVMLQVIYTIGFARGAQVY